jgi:hypothetical protein
MRARSSQPTRTAPCSDADFIIEFMPGFYFGAALRGDLLTDAPCKGTHGCLPERPEMHAAFFAKGAGIARGRNLGVVDMRAIAPPLARLLTARCT